MFNVAGPFLRDRPGIRRTGWPWEAPVGMFEKPNGKQQPWPRVTVVTPSYNQGEYIEETILSVLRQGYPQLEYIVVDGGSTDQTREILDRYRSEDLRIICEPDEGQSDAIAKGFEVATGEIFAWLCADDVYLPGALYWIAEQFRRFPNTDLICGETNLDQGTGWEDWMELRFVNSTPTHAKLLACGQCVRQPSCFWRRDAYRRCGGVDRALRFCVDYDLFLRLCRDGTARYVDHEVAWMRSHSLSKSSTLMDVMHVEQRALVERELGRTSVPVWRLNLIAYINRARCILRNHRESLPRRAQRVLRLACGYVFHAVRGDPLTWHPLDGYGGKRGP